MLKPYLRKNQHNPHSTSLRGPRLMRGALFFVACSLGFLTLAQVAHANSPDAKKPTEITADHVEFDDQDGTAYYQGHVISKQGSRLLHSDTLKIFRGQNNQIEMMHATGQPSRFQAQPDPNKPIGFGKANDIKYYPEEDKAVLVGNAELEQNGDIIRGPEIVYFFSTGKMISSNSEGRTTVVIQSRKGD